MQGMTKCSVGKAIGAALALAVVLAPTAVFAQANAASGVTNTTHIPLSGTTATGQAFSATMRLQRFERVAGQYLAIGVLENGTLNGQSLAGQAIAIPMKVARSGGSGADSGDSSEQGSSGALGVPTLRVVPAQATCTILHLTLAPLDLNLLGLLVHLNQVVLNIDALPGGGLLGSLLCGVANLLNGVNLLATLNNVLGALNGLGL